MKAAKVDRFGVKVTLASIAGLSFALWACANAPSAPATTTTAAAEISEIQVASEEGQGTTVSFSLPVLKERA